MLHNSSAIDYHSQRITEFLGTSPFVRERISYFHVDGYDEPRPYLCPKDGRRFVQWALQKGYFDPEKALPLLVQLDAIQDQNAPGCGVADHDLHD